MTTPVTNSSTIVEETVANVEVDGCKRDYFCYVLQSCANTRSSYVGITNNRRRRIRQHNSEIVGGAKRTKRDQPWRMVAAIGGFNHNEAQRFEWSMHHPRKRKITGNCSGPIGRIDCAKKLLQQNPWKKRLVIVDSTPTFDSVTSSSEPPLVLYTVSSLCDMRECLSSTLII